MNIRLTRLTLKNFRGVKEFTAFDGGEWQTAEVSGRNATGKTTLMNAYLWLLWGYDIEDKKDYNIKTLRDGESIPKTETEVTATFDKDGDEITIGRKFVEKWEKPRGQAEEVFRGNTTEYSFNGVPIKMSEYNAIIADLGGDRLRSLTTAEAFMTQDWKKMRAELVAISGVNEELIRAKYPDLFGEGKKPLETRTAELKASKKKLKKDLDEIQPRIDQTITLKPSEDDWAGIEAEIKAADEKLGGFEKEIGEREQATAEILKEERATRDRLTEIAKAKADITAQVAKETAEAEAKTHRAKSGAEWDKEKAEKEYARNEKLIKDDEKRLKDWEAELKEKEAEKAEETKKWKVQKALVFDESGAVCPTCGQPLPPDKVREARATFDKTKSLLLESITRRGTKLKDRIDYLSQEIAETRKGLSAYEKEQEEYESIIAALTAKIEAEKTGESRPETPTVTPAEEREEWKALTAEEEELNARLEGATKEEDKRLEAAKEERAKVLEVRDELKKRLGKREDIRASEAAVEALWQKGALLSEEIAEIERVEQMIADYTREYMEAVSESVNGRFETVSFRLFEETLDGNPVEVCVPLIKGKPYYTGSSAERINAGIEVIETLQRAYSLTAPTWVDGTESVNTPRTKEEGQTILLTVTNEDFNITTATR